MKSDKDFLDELARQALSNYKAEFNPEDWDNLARQLDREKQQKASGTDKVDSMARQQALSDYKAPYNPKDWVHLERMLEGQLRRQPKFWLFKGLEFGLIALAALGIWTYRDALLPYSSSNNPAAGQVQAEASAALASGKPKPKNGGAKSSANGGDSIQAQPSETQGSGTENRFGAKPWAEPGQLGPKGKAPKARIVQGSSSSAQGGANSPKSKALGAQAPQVMAANLGGDDSLLPAQAQSGQNLGSSPLDANKAIAQTLGQGAEEQVLAQGIALLDNRFPNFLQTEPEPKPFELKKHKLERQFFTQNRLGLSLGATRPSNLKAGRAKMGYHLGGLFEMELSKRWSLSTAFNFYQLNFELQDVQAVEDPRQEGLFYQVRQDSRTQISRLQVPLMLQFALFRDEKWRILAQGGIAGGLILSRHTSGSLDMQMHQASGELMVSTVINPQDYERGLSEGLAQNLYGAAILSLSIERQLSDKFLLFVQPQGQVSLNGTGREGFDRMNGFSLNMGIKAGLK